MICSPWYLLVVYTWDIVGFRLFLAVYIVLYIWGFLYVGFSCNRTQYRGLGTYFLSIYSFIVILL